MDFAGLNVLDLLIGIFIVVSVLRGARTGFLAGVFSLVGEVIARSMGGSLRNRLSSPTSATLDGLGGALLGCALALVLVWAVGVFALQSPILASLQPVAQDSRILQTLKEGMPSGLLTQAVADLQPLP